MKKFLRLLCGLLTLCLLAAPACPAARAADTGRTITLQAGAVDMSTALKDAQDGDTIILNGSVGITNMSGGDGPWIIDKAVTIQGGTLGLRAGGIILNADVTFRNTTLSFEPYVRNAIMANGHTLTLENVGCDSSTRSVNLFCGGLYDPKPDGLGSTPGPEGKIIIKGSTSLKGDGAPGNLYAGNLCMGGMTAADSAVNGPANRYDGSASIQIESGDATLGNIYAGGAQQKIPYGSASGKVILTNPTEYTTEGPVDIRLTGGSVKAVDGAGANGVSVTYNGDANSTDLTVKNVSGLRVETGSLAPTAQSGLSESTALAVAQGAKLDLTKLGDVTVGSLEGGGTLVLGQSQSLTIDGSVSGTTTVGIGALNAGGFSTMPPMNGHTYIRAPLSEEGAFVLTPPEGFEQQLERDENGNWSVPAGDASTLVESFAFEAAQSSFDSGAIYEELPLTVTLNSADDPTLESLPLTVVVNGRPAEMQWDGAYYTYTTPELFVEPVGNCVCISSRDGEFSPIADGVYVLQLTVPGEYAAAGQPLSARTVLTVGTPTPPAALVASIGFTPDQPSPVSGEYAQLDLAVTFADNGASEPALAALPLTVTVNSASAARQETDAGCVYTAPGLSIKVTGNEIGVTGEKGEYTIALTVPGEHTATGQPLSTETTLNITDAVVTPPPAEPLVYQLQNASADDAQVTVDVAALTADAAPGATVLAAAYTQDGRMCAAATVPVAAAGTVRVPLDSSGADYVTVFIVDGTGSLKPLGQNLSVAKGTA